MDGVAAPGDIVWHGFWDEFAPLFHWNPRVRWITGMDPWYLVAHDRGAPLLMARIVSADFEHDADLRRALTERFGARFVLLWRRNPYQALEARLEGVPWATVVHDDPNAIVFRID